MADLHCEQACGRRAAYLVTTPADAPRTLACGNHLAAAVRKVTAGGTWPAHVFPADGNEVNRG